MKRFGVAFSIVVLLVTFAVLAAAGGKPTMIQFGPASPFVISAADSGCGFDMLVSPQAGRPSREKAILFSNSVIVTGPLFSTLQNLTTNKTANVNATGPATVTFSDNTLVARGTSFTTLPANVAQAAGLPTVALTSGALTLTFDDMGNIASASLTGTAQDACLLVE